MDHKGRNINDRGISIAPASLNDVAALLVMLDPTAPADLAQVRNALSRLIDGGSDQELLGKALLQLDSLLRGSASEPELAWAEVGRLVEAALNAAENTGEAEGQNADLGVRADLIEQEDGATVAAGEPVITNSNEQANDYLSADLDQELLREFVIESYEYIEGAEAALLSLETQPKDMEAVNTIFRAFHTIKGTSAYLGLPQVMELAHFAESLLSRVREQEIRCTGGYADLALRSIDMLRQLLGGVQNAISGQSAGQIMNKPAGYDELLVVLTDPEAAGVSGNIPEALSGQPRLGEILIARGCAERDDIEAVEATRGESPLGLALVKAEIATVTEVAHALRTQQRTAAAEQSVESSVRVRTDRLDGLIDMVGELVIAHSMVAQDDAVLQGPHREFARKVTHAGKIVRELQALSLSLRMVPLKATFQKMTRLVRDIAQKQGKLISLITDDGDVEIDRNMVDGISDILIHMVRNAVDHGIESPDAREQSGKSRTGTVRLAAYHSGGSVVVDISDDGRGLDRDKIIAKAVERNLIESGAGLPDSEVYNLIFEPGFSTADQLTDISGRGVGMDVVRRQVENLRGRIEIASEHGRGANLSIRLPLTLALTDGMLVRVGAERYIIPTVNIHLSFRPMADAVNTIAGRGEMVMLRGELMPIFRLHRLFGIDGAVEDVTKGLLVVVDDGERRCTILVDMLLGKQQVVAKSLGAGIGKSMGISGAAILGDGRVGLILDPSELITSARQNGRGDASRPAA